ncbi:citron Rho-interacting kinase-like isoform X3 [Leptopilina boulardi]|uniref:citron Rho-interacting kinase-like isoform X3 n=1 Tax=Leptopilina boulardi TaxID=63433 RepID=UPI0021F5EE24|nr:citron Rho-interacting kinase-like isoform X3 [Leptopilina boulardi]
MESSRRMLDKMDLDVEFENKKRELKEVREQRKKLLELQDKTSLNLKANSNLESQLTEKSKQLDLSNRKRDNLERELVTSRSEAAGIKRILELERQERRELETRALNLIKGAKRKWENAEKDKIAQLNKHIETQTTRIAELCSSNNDMSARLQRAESELKTSTAELKKLRSFQVQYKESLAKMRELNRQSAQGVGNKLEQMAARAHNQIAELRTKLELEVAKTADLESNLRDEQDSNHCRQSRLNVALELAQSELRDCQEQLRSLKATIPARDAEMEELKKELHQKTIQLENAVVNEQTVISMQEQIERICAENDQLRNQLEATKSDLSDTLMSLEQRESIALSLERVEQDRATLELRLRSSLEKEEEQLRKVSNLEELLRRLEQSVSKLETENATLKAIDHEKPQAPKRLSSIDYNNYHGKNISQLEQQLQKLEQQLQTANENLAAEQKVAKQAQISLWKKEKELSDANLDKRIATREAKTAEEKIKNLQDDKHRLLEKLKKMEKDEEDKSAKLLKEMESAKLSLNEITRESSRNKMQADSAQRALTQANKQIEELQNSSAALRRELDATRKQVRGNQDRMDSFKAENERLKLQISKHNDTQDEYEAKLEKLQEEVNSYHVNNVLLKETCTVLEEQLTDYERLTNDHETRENTLIQEKMRLQKELESTEVNLREAKIAQNEEKTMRLVAERAIERLESDASDIEGERNTLSSQRDEYKKLAQKLNEEIGVLTIKCDSLECDLSQTRRLLDVSKEEARIVKEESSQHLTRLHELKETNLNLMADLQDTVDQSQELRTRVAELEGVMDEMRQFYQEREVKAGSTCQQQTKLIDYLQLKLEECGKKKKGVCDKIFGSKKENTPPNVGAAMPVGYRELENQLDKERAKVKALTEQILTTKTAKLTTSPLKSTSPRQSPEKKYIDNSTDMMTRHLSLQRIKHNIPHRFNISLPMRAGKCSACLDSIQFGKRAAICSECQIMTHLKCSVSVPATCGLPGDFARHFGKYSRDSLNSLSSNGESVRTLAIDEPDKPERDTDYLMKTNQQQKNNDNELVTMESWVKVPGRGKSCWERKYLKLEGANLLIYEHQPSPGMVPINRLELTEKDGFIINDAVEMADVVGTAKSDLPFIIRVEPNSPTTCWPTARLDIMALSQLDKKNWLKALKSLSNTPKIDKYHTVLRLEKNQLDLNCLVELSEEGVLLLGAEEGLYSYQSSKAQVLTAIRGVKKVHQLTLHPKLGLALMIAGEDRQLVACDLRQLKSNAVAAECSRPAINTKPVLTGSESCHLYQVQGEMLCAATTSHVILLKWTVNEDSGEFIGIRELETQEPCSCALFARNILIVGCNKFYQIDMTTYEIDDFPEEDDNSIKAALMGVARLGIFPVCVLDVSSNPQHVELLLCYNEFGVFVNEKGQRTRNINPNWSHLPFAFAYRKPYLFIVHFSSVEIIKIDSESFKSYSNKPERTLMEFNNPRYLGLAGTKGIYISAVNTVLELLKIEGNSLIRNSGSLTSIDTLCQNEDSSSEFSFTSSLMDVLDNNGRKVHFSNVSNN